MLFWCVNIAIYGTHSAHLLSTKIAMTVTTICEGYSVSANLDFGGYLNIDTKEEQIAMQYRTLLDYQKNW